VFQLHDYDSCLLYTVGVAWVGFEGEGSQHQAAPASELTGRVISPAVQHTQLLKTHSYTAVQHPQLLKTHGYTAVHRPAPPHTLAFCNGHAAPKPSRSDTSARA
jgi:hypothetical protein